MADCIGTGFPQFPCALAVRKAVRKEVTGNKEGKEEKRGKRWRICIRQVAIQVETRMIYIYI